VDPTRGRKSGSVSTALKGSNWESEAVQFGNSFHAVPTEEEILPKTSFAGTNREKKGERGRGNQGKTSKRTTKGLLDTEEERRKGFTIRSYPFCHLRRGT